MKESIIVSQAIVQGETIAIYRHFDFDDFPVFVNFETEKNKQFFPNNAIETVERNSRFS